MLPPDRARSVKKTSVQLVNGLPQAQETAPCLKLISCGQNCKACWLDALRALFFDRAAVATNRLTGIYIDGGVLPVKLFRQKSVKFLINGFVEIVSY